MTLPKLKYKHIYFGLTLNLIILLYATTVFTGDATLSWTPPTTNADGTPLTDLAGYKVYYGTSTGNYSQSIDVGNVTTYQVSNLIDGLTYYFVVTAYDISGNESGYSNEVSKTIQFTVTYYCDNDNDTYINSSSDGTCTEIGCVPSGCQTVPGDDCDDNDDTVYPGATELCDNKDNDCDGPIDENLTRPTTCGVGECAGNTGEETCTAGTWGNDTCDPFAGTTTEICDDGLDNDCDGTVDEIDSGCISISFHPYDTNQDWIIGDFELLDAIDDWAGGNLGDFELLDLIDYWAAGCYQWNDVSSIWEVCP